MFGKQRIDILIGLQHKDDIGRHNELVKMNKIFEIFESD